MCAYPRLPRALAGTWRMPSVCQQAYTRSNAPYVTLINILSYYNAFKPLFDHCIRMRLEISVQYSFTSETSDSQRELFHIIPYM